MLSFKKTKGIEAKRKEFQRRIEQVKKERKRNIDLRLVDANEPKEKKKKKKEIAIKILRAIFVEEQPRRRRRRKVRRNTRRSRRKR